MYTWQIIGGTANNIQDCKTLIEKQVDYITLSPFRNKEATDHLALSLNGYSLIAEELKTETPIIGFGGITKEDVTDLISISLFNLRCNYAVDDGYVTANKNKFHRLRKY